MSSSEFWIYVTFILSILFFGGAAVYALSWAMEQGEFENFDRSAKGIFDPDEPIGQTTDWFPGEGKRTDSQEQVNV